MRKVISWEHLRILPCFPGREATSIYGRCSLPSFLGFGRTMGSGAELANVKSSREDLMDEEGENPNLHPGSEGLLATFPPPTLAQMQRIFSTCIFCEYR